MLNNILIKEYIYILISQNKMSTLFDTIRCIEPSLISCILRYMHHPNGVDTTRVMIQNGILTFQEYNKHWYNLLMNIHNIKQYNKYDELVNYENIDYGFFYSVIMSNQKHIYALIPDKNLSNKASNKTSNKALSKIFPITCDDLGCISYPSDEEDSHSITESSDDSPRDDLSCNKKEIIDFSKYKVVIAYNQTYIGAKGIIHNFRQCKSIKWNPKLLRKTLICYASNIDYTEDYNNEYLDNISVLEELIQHREIELLSYFIDENENNNYGNLMERFVNNIPDNPELFHKMFYHYIDCICNDSDLLDELNYIFYHCLKTNNVEYMRIFNDLLTEHNINKYKFKPICNTIEGNLLSNNVSVDMFETIINMCKLRKYQYIPLCIRLGCLPKFKECLDTFSLEECVISDKTIKDKHSLSCLIFECINHGSYEIINCLFDYLLQHKIMLKTLPKNNVELLKTIIKDINRKINISNDNKSILVGKYIDILLNSFNLFNVCRLVSDFDLNDFKFIVKYSDIEVCKKIFTTYVEHNNRAKLLSKRPELAQYITTNHNIPIDIILKYSTYVPKKILIQTFVNGAHQPRIIRMFLDCKCIEPSMNNNLPLARARTLGDIDLCNLLLEDKTVRELDMLNQ